MEHQIEMGADTGRIPDCLCQWRLSADGIQQLPGRLLRAKGEMTMECRIHNGGCGHHKWTIDSSHFPVPKQYPIPHCRSPLHSSLRNTNLSLNQNNLPYICTAEWSFWTFLSAKIDLRLRHLFYKNVIFSKSLNSTMWYCTLFILPPPLFFVWTRQWCRLTLKSKSKKDHLHSESINIHRR